MRAAVIAAAATLTACSGGTSAANDTAAIGNAESAASRGQVVDRDTVLGERWQSLFDQPDMVTAALNEFGYQLAPATVAADGRWTARGVEQVLPKPDAPVTVTTNVTVTGPTRDRVDAIRLGFDVRKHGDVTRKRDLDAAAYPSRIVRGVVSRFEVAPTPAVVAALRSGDSATGSEYGGTIAVVASTLAGTDADHGKHLDVTISPAGARPTGATARK